MSSLSSVGHHALRVVAVFAMLGAASCGGDGDGTGANAGPAPSLELFVGNMGGAGNADGAAYVARFNTPTGVASDSSGNIYVADSHSNTIRKISSTGEVTTFAGAAGQFGSVDGVGTAARFRNPVGVATDVAGNVFIADFDNRAVRRVTAAGVVTTLATDVGSPSAIATDAVGNVYVADARYSDNRFYGNTIRKITSAGVVTTLAGMTDVVGDADGLGQHASFNYPQGIATDAAGNVYVADTGNSRIRKISPGGAVTTLTDAAGGKLVLDRQPYGVAVDEAGNVYATAVIVVYMVTTGGTLMEFAGSPVSSGSADGQGAGAAFARLHGLAFDRTGYLYAADAGNHNIRKLSTAGEVTTAAGVAAQTGNLDRNGAAARFGGAFGSPYGEGPPASTAGIAADSAGNLYVVDTGNYAVRKVTPGGDVTTLAGGFQSALGVATDSAGNVFVVERFGTISKIAPSGSVSALAGATFTTGSADGVGAAARFQFPSGAATDSAGNLYVTDTGNSTVRKISPAGVVTTFAGRAGASGNADGTGSDARFTSPEGIATDSAGNVFVADVAECTIRKITPSGVVTTLAGAAGIAGSADGIGGAARFNGPRGLATDDKGNVYVADTYNHTIRKVAPGGSVTTLVGVPGTSGFSGGSLPGALAMPYGVVVSGSSLYVATYQGVAVIRNLP